MSKEKLQILKFVLRKLFHHDTEKSVKGLEEGRLSLLKKISVTDPSPKPEGK